MLYDLSKVKNFDLRVFSTSIIYIYLLSPTKFNYIDSEPVAAGCTELGFVREEFLEVKLECPDETETCVIVNSDHQTSTNRQGNQYLRFYISTSTESWKFKKKLADKNSTTNYFKTTIALLYI